MPAQREILVTFQAKLKRIIRHAKKRARLQTGCRLKTTTAE